VIEDLRQHIHAALGEAPKSIVLDGRVHRFGPKRSSEPFWYIAYGDGIPSAAFGSWASRESYKWHYKSGKPLSNEELELQHARYKEAIKARDAERKARAEQARHTCLQLWESASIASDEHQYLSRKKVASYGLRQTTNGDLLVPLFGSNGELTSLQRIEPSGDKQYYPGGVVEGSSFTIEGYGDTVYIAEGYATAATIHAATGATVEVAFSSGNIPHTAGSICERHKGKSVVIVADNDPREAGEKAAIEACEAYECTYIMVPSVGQDANDFVNSGGDLVKLLIPKPPWLATFSSLIAQPEPVKWIVKNWIPRGALGMLHATSGAGKTFAMLDIALRIASGMSDWCGNIIRGGTVVYLAGEGHNGVRERLAAWSQRHGISDSDLYVSRTGCSLDTREGLHTVMSAVSSLPQTPVLIVVDTLHRFLEGDENSSQDASKMIRACDELRDEFGCSVMLVHHTGHSEIAQTRARGSSAWKGALDFEISMSVQDDLRILKPVKVKDRACPSSIYLSLDPVTIDGWIDEDGEPVSSLVAVEACRPPEVQAPSASAIACALIGSVWHSAGREQSNGSPTISNSAAKRILQKKHGLKPRAADSTITEWTTSGLAESDGKNITITDPATASVLLLK